ncbi:hypothetical protein HB771_09340 [Rhizobium leguminosarum bv. viciae]|nr:hypothetical protein HB771_09340 [Rhizobium leguminosarum bv. viciae]
MQDLIYDAETVARLIDLIEFRFAIPVQPYPDEGLADVLFRAAGLNAFHTTSILTGPLGLPSNKRMTPEGLAKANLEPRLVADLLGTRRSTDMDAHALRWTDQIGMRTDFFGRDVRLRGFFSSGRRVAPTSLASGCYQRAVWSVASLSFDPQSRERLLSRCPICGVKPDFARAHGVHICPTCHLKGTRTDFRDFPQDKVIVDDEDALTFWTSLINPAISVHEIDVSRLHGDLREFGPGQLFQLITGMASTLSRVAKEHEEERADALPLPSDFAAATRSILGWPAGVCGYANRLALLQPSGAEPRFNVMRSAITAVVPKLQKMVLDLSHSARRDIVLKDLGVLVRPRETIPDEAADRVGADRIRSSPRGNLGLPNLRRIVHRHIAEKRSLTEFKASYIRLSSAAAVRLLSDRLGIPIPFLLEVLDCGMVCASGLSEVTPLETTLLDAAIPRNPQEGDMPLGATLSALCGRRINPWPAVLQAIANETLGVSLRKDTGGALVDRVYVRDFLGILDVLSGVKVDTSLVELTADNRSVAFVMGTTLQRTVTLQRQRAFPIEPGFDDLWRFRQANITTLEVQRRIAMSTGRTPALQRIVAELADASCERLGRQVRGSLITIHHRRQVESLYNGRLFAADRE